MERTRLRGTAGPQTYSRPRLEAPTVRDTSSGCKQSVSSPGAVVWGRLAAGKASNRDAQAPPHAPEGRTDRGVPLHPFGDMVTDPRISFRRFPPTAWESGHVGVGEWSEESSWGNKMDASATRSTVRTLVSRIDFSPNCGSTGGRGRIAMRPHVYVGAVFDNRPALAGCWRRAIRICALIQRGRGPAPGRESPPGCDPLVRP